MKTKKQRSAKTATGITIRPFRKNDVDFVISRQLSLYASEYGFTSEIWRSYLTGGVHDFVNRSDSNKDCMDILEKNGVPSGCIAIMHVDEATAQLRFYFLEPEMRGQGAGRRLLDRVNGFAGKTSMNVCFYGRSLHLLLHGTCMPAGDFR